MVEQKVMVPQPDGTEKEMTVVFMDGCFDGLLEEGTTPEELERIRQEILHAIQSGSFFEESAPVEDEEWEQIQKKINQRQ